MLKRLNFLLLLLATAGPASANEACKLFDALSRIHTSVSLIVSHPNSAIMQVQMPRLRSELLFLDFESAAQQLHDTMAPDDISTLLTEIAFASAVVIAADTSDTQLISRVTAPHVAPMLNQARGIIDTNICNSLTQTISTTQGTAITVPDSNNTLELNEIGAVRKLNFQANVAIFVSFTALLIAISASRIIRRKYIEIRGRRAKRYGAFVPLLFATGVEDYDGLLCDVSRSGCQFAHRGELNGLNLRAIKLLITDRWFEGKIVWDKEKHCGVEFDRKLDHQMVENIRNAHDGRLRRLWRKAKRRPMGRRSRVKVTKA